MGKNGGGRVVWLESRGFLAAAGPDRSGEREADFFRVVELVVVVLEGVVEDLEVDFDVWKG